MLDALGDGWVHSFAIKTGMPRDSGYPTTYKVDVGMPSVKVAVECDGQSHNGAKAQARDAKKDSLLESLGWIVLRFKNQEIFSDIHGCVSKVESVVRSRSTT